MSNLAQTLAAEDDLRVIGTARSVSEARRRLANAVPDVVLVNHRLPDGDAIAALSELQAVQPTTRFLLLTTRTNDKDLVRAIEAGASGFIEKSQSLRVLCSAVRAAHGGDAVIASPLLTRLLPLMRRRPDDWQVRVSERDCELLALMAEGLSNAEIAERAAVDVSDVQQQVATLSTKLGAHSKLEALSIASRRGLLSQFDG